MLIYEFRIVMPMTVEEYQVAQLWSCAEASKNETGGGEGIEVVKNEPFDDQAFLDGQFTNGQFTHKIYHLSKRVPGIVRLLAPKGSLQICEDSWNAFPYCKTYIDNPGYMKDNFFIQLESMHLNDRGTTDNVHNLSEDELKKRKVVYIDIANDKVSDYKEEWDPQKFTSKKTGRGPITGADWKETCQPFMCCYKLVRVRFKWTGVQGKVEKFIMDLEQRIFTNFHRQLFCWMDEWHGLTMEQVREIEEKVKTELDERRQNPDAKTFTKVS